MLEKILIANRGEIACRVIRTAKRMGIATVAVYSDADADSLHVRSADEAVRIGPAPSAQSYLCPEAILAAAGDTGSDAIHPGFGFLAENAEFAARVRVNGVVFLGPPAGAIAAMGDKIESKRLAEQAGVSVIPGYHAALRDADEAVVVSRDIGYPVILKASAGGGGKGMRVAHDDDEVRAGFPSAASEAVSSFGDDRVFVEKYIESPRHIEIQILGDGYGNIVHLGERECSIQRRHQKILEEAPSLFVDPETRHNMAAQAIALARAVAYESVGTVEFIVDRSHDFYFLEMNARLQVEHPVTELVTGLDLVELMIRVGAGEPIPFDQAAVRQTGWAVEARVYAEDPERDFLPATGRLNRHTPPAQGPNVRVDTGVDEGSEISVYYDPMIAKLITYAPTREEAVTELARSVDAYTIRGVSHNLAFLSAVAHHPRFRNGDLSTTFIDEEFPTGFDAQQSAHENPMRLLYTAACLQMEVDRHEAMVGGTNTSELGERDYVLVVAGSDRVEVSLSVRKLGTEFEIDGESGRRRVGLRWRLGQDRAQVQTDGGSYYSVQVVRNGYGWELSQGGRTVSVRVLGARAAELDRLMPVKQVPDMSRYLLSPMPGLLLRLSVRDGDPVKSGQELAVVEAMKMENALFAAYDGRVARVLCEAGESLAVDQPIIEFE